MDIVSTRSDLRAARFDLKGKVGFVPTMGALHAGHMALVKSSIRACDSTVVSIFVNPTQFGNPEDLEKYPDTLSDDLDQLEAAGVDLVFTPDAQEMYGHAGDTFVETKRLAHMLMGALRPGHFRGVATVVTKLFNLVRPDAAWFGEKDYQQVQVITQMVNDLDMDIDIVPHPTVRDPDGVAMSSRNLRLTPADRAAAPILYAALQKAQGLAIDGASATAIRKATRKKIELEPRANLKSLDLRDAVSLNPVPRGALQSSAVLLLAAEFGDILLIDNVVLKPSSG